MKNLMPPMAKQENLGSVTILHFMGSTTSFAEFYVAKPNLEDAPLYVGVLFLVNTFDTLGICSQVSFPSIKGSKM